MHDGLSICQTKFCETTFLALPCPVYLIFISSSSGLHIITSEVSKKHQYFRMATKLAKTYLNMWL